MRALSGPLSAAASLLTSTPDYKLELADATPHFASVATPGAGGPCAAIIAPDGAIIAAYVLGTNVYAVRVTDPTIAAQWTTWGLITNDGRQTAGVALVSNGTTVRLLYQQNSAPDLRYVDTTNSGVGWSAPATLFNFGTHVCYGIAADADLNTVIIAYDNGGLGAVRLAVWKNTGVWAGTDWTNGDLNTIVGIAAVRKANLDYTVIVAGQGISGTPYGLYNLVYTSVATWSTLGASIRGADVAAGIVIRYPHITFFDGLYRLTYLEQDTGASSGITYTRTDRAVSADAVHFTAATPALTAMPFGAAWVKHAKGQVLASFDAVLLAPAYNPATMYRDLTADVQHLEVIEVEGKPARLVCVLDNSTGAYTNLAALVKHAQVMLSQGYVGVGLVPTHLFYVDGWTFGRAAEVNEVTIGASDLSRVLARQTRYPISYGNRSVAYLIGDLTALAGFTNAAVVDGSPQFMQNITQFQLLPGQSYLAALRRLLAGYDGACSVRVVAGSGSAFAVQDQPVVIGKSASQAVVWSYNGEPEYLRFSQSGDRANHVVVYGPQNIPTAVAEAWDAVDLAIRGQEYYALIVEQLAGSAAAAATVATLAMARETRLATRVELAVAPHPGLELFDAISVGDAVLPVVTGRIVGLTLTYEPRTALYNLAITCEGM